MKGQRNFSLHLDMGVFFISFIPPRVANFRRSMATSPPSGPGKEFGAYVNDGLEIYGFLTDLSLVQGWRGFMRNRFSCNVVLWIDMV